MSRSRIDRVAGMEKTYHRTEASAMKWIRGMTKNRGYRVKQDPIWSNKHSCWMAYYTRPVVYQQELRED